MRMYGIEMLLGIITGAAVGLLVGLIFLKYTKTDGRIRCKYDERQTRARGAAYKRSYFTLAAGGVIYAFLISTVGLPIDSGVGILVLVLISIGVHVSYSIRHDAYFSLNENKKRVLICFGVIGGVNLLLGILRVADGSACAGGRLRFESINLFCGLLFLWVFLVVLLKQGADRIDGEE